MYTVESLLQRFEPLTTNFSVAGCPWAAQFQGGNPGMHVVFSAIVHGVEVGPLPALVELAERFAAGHERFTGTVTFLLGNVAAARQGKRLIDHDLNRVFHPDAPASCERERGLEMMKVLDCADVYVDFHQTREPCENPFFTFEFDWLSYQWARISGAADRFVTRRPGVSFSPGEVCTDEYVRNRGCAGLTAEMGAKGFSPQVTQKTLASMRRVIAAAEALLRGGRTLAELARRWEPPQIHIVAHKEGFWNPELKLNLGLHNFTAIRAGQVIGVGPESQPLLAPTSGYMLFPRYPDRDDDGKAVAPYSDELYRLVKPINQRQINRFIKQSRSRG